MILQQPHIGNRFISLKKVSELLDLLNTNVEKFLNSVSKPEYQTFYIGKKNGKKRKIQSPSPELMKLQSRLANILNTVYFYHHPNCVHGYVKKFNEPSFSIVTNAKMHVGKKLLLNLDLQDFFPSITTQMVKEMFSQKLKLPDQVSAALALLCTFEGKLPQGSPTSPIISNFILIEIDKKIQSFCSDFNITYSRYADDLTFSTNEVAFQQTALTTFKTELEKILSIDGFSINPKKIFLRTSKQKQMVCGIKVNEKLNINRSYKKQTRAMLHDFKRKGLEIAAQNYFTKWRPGEIVDAKKFLEILRGREEWERSVKIS